MDYGLAFFVYRRPVHTKKVLDSIKRNGFKKIYVFHDKVKNETALKDWKKVEEIIKKIDFADVEYHQSPTNKGLANSIVDGINYVLSKHDAVIALEDDVVLADGYKTYVEECMEKYINNGKVMSFCGGGVTDQIVDTVDIKDDVYFSYNPSSFAWGTWKDRWQLYRRDNDYLNSFLTDETRVEHVSKLAGNDLIQMATIVKNSPEKIDTWATFWGLIQAENDGVCVTPVKALAKGIGLDGSGTNCGNVAKLFELKLSTKIEGFKLPDDVVDNEYLNERVRIVANSSRYYARCVKLFVAYCKHKLGVRI